MISNLVTTQSIGLACGVGFLAYCVYFDHKRRSAPDYRDKVRARALNDMTQLTGREEDRKREEAKDRIELPDLTDKVAIERFFIEEIQRGEELMEAGEIEKAVKHISLAIVVCSQPQQICAYFKETLPTRVYKAVVEALPHASELLQESARRNSDLVVEEVE